MSERDPKDTVGPDLFNWIGIAFVIMVVLFILFVLFFGRTLH